MKKILSLRVNGDPVQVAVRPEANLLHVLRVDLGLTGTKFGCGIGVCGACTVHLDGVAFRSCVTPVAAAKDARIFTIEGLSEDGSHPVQQAWVEEQVPQCGYCQPGQILVASALLLRNSNPTDEEIESAMSGVLCRCGTYQRIRRVIRRVAGAGGE